MSQELIVDGRNDELLSARGLHKTFGHVPVLIDVNFSIRKGEKVCILGPSGSGKTTLLRCLNLLVQPTEGQLWFKGELVGSWPEQPRSRPDMGAYRSHVSMVFQQFELFPHLSACDNITLGPKNVLHLEPKVAKERALALLDRVGLRAFADARPRTLSGGQQQRVAIARSLAMEPDVILFDEPTSALDWEMVGEVLDIMASLAAEGMTMVIVTHELEFARQCADRIIVMEKGRIIEEGPTYKMFEEATQVRTREILGIVRSEAVYRRAHIGPAAPGDPPASVAETT